MQAAVDAYYAKPNPQWGETFSIAGPIHGYSNRTYPVTTSDGIVDANHYLTVNYYDGYYFRDKWVETYGYTDDNLTASVDGLSYQQPGELSSHVKGLITGSMAKVLDGGVRGGHSWLKTVNYYDDKRRLVQLVADNYKGGMDRFSSLFDFTGRILKAKTVHTTNEISWNGLTNAVVVGNTMKKTFLGLGWNSGGITREQLPAGVDGWIECIISEPDQRRAFGLNATDEGRNYNTIDYAFWHDATAARIYENGAMKYQLPETVKSGDVIRIERAGSQINYYRNGVLLYTTSNASTGVLIGDASLGRNLVTNQLKSGKSYEGAFQEPINAEDFNHSLRAHETAHYEQQIKSGFVNFYRRTIAQYFKYGYNVYGTRGTYEYEANMYSLKLLGYYYSIYWQKRTVP